MKILPLLLTAAFLFSQAPGEHKSIHQIEWEEHLNDAVDQPILFKTSVTPVEPLQEQDPNWPVLTDAVFGYLPDWKYSSAPQYFDYALLSHIALFDFLVSPQGSITQYPSGWPDNWMNMMNKAHRKGTKLIMCVVEFNDDDIHALINDTTATNNFYQNVAHVISTYNLDGVNIDFEGPKTADRGAPMNRFMQGLSDYLKTNVGPEQEISFAGPAVNWGGWDLPGLVDACDYVFIMGYAYWWNGASTTGPCAPITGSSINLVQTIVNSSNGYGSCDKSKLILGLPYYGNKWKVSYAERATVNATTLASGSSVVYASAKDYYRDYGRRWSTKYEDPWTFYQSNGDWYQAWCNDAEALNAKEELVFSYNLFGTGMWALGYDEEHTELWDVLRENFLQFEDTLLLDDFENGIGHFYRQPSYSGSTTGIANTSSADTTSEESYLGDHAMKIILQDDPSSSNDWVVRYLSGSGGPLNNTQFPRGREIRFALKTAQAGIDVAVMIDDDNSQMEQSVRMAVIGDNAWHTYSVRLDSCELWTSYNNGNGAIDGDFVTLDALMFYAANGSSDITLYLDDVNAVKIDNPIGTSVEVLPETCELHTNYPNPFNAQTTLRFDIENNARVSLDIYDINGKRVETLVNGYLNSGTYQRSWICTNQPSGMYLAILRVDGQPVGSQKMLLVK
jgi:spore germination protein YaaH